MANDKDERSSQKTQDKSPDAAQTAEETANDPRQSPEARAKHNNEHLPTGEFKEGCYFCDQQQAGAQGPVQVPGYPLRG